MKVKRVKIGIKGVREALDDFVKTAKAIERGEKIKKEKGVYFEGIEGFRKALTPGSLALLHLIEESRPKSLQDLARLSGRDMKAIVTDISILEELGLVDMKRKREGRRKTTPTVEYDRMDLEIAV
ncbi:MAG: winged helix DNA-binding protein [Deltaproteobacteria bacterium]|nr:winged helix DNA-binding protein [Deltaproteobacteria bacterium]